jgi:dolichol-phosphate mannosyltransferase
MSKKISVVVPVYNERENIGKCLRGLWTALANVPHEILVCYDFDADTTLAGIAEMSDAPPSLRLVKNTIGRGAANALRAGFAAADGDVVVTTMADLSDPPEVIAIMAETMRRDHLAVVAGSRYMRGGSQTGGPFLKRTLSCIAGVSLDWIARIGTKDATSNFRAYSKEFLDSVTIESDLGFEIALELTVKAHLAGRGVGEVPSSWVDRTAGESRFRLWKWMPNYLRWWWKAAWKPLLVYTLILAALGASFVYFRAR